MNALGVLGLIFVVLKLVGVIAWSWWLVLLPFYGVLALILGILGLFAVVGGVLLAALRGGKR
jgi:hypothetical protein